MNTRSSFLVRTCITTERKSKYIIMLFSIITVCRNSEKTIERTIESVINQTCDDYEYIIVDGASTDSTLDIIKRAYNNHPDKIRYVSEPDKGIYDAMNKGIRMAKGEIIGIINSDDWYEQNALKVVKDNYNREKQLQVLYGMIRIYRNKKIMQVLMNRIEFIDDYPIMHPATFVSKAIYEKYGLFDCKYKYVADYDYFIRLAKQKDVCFIPIEEILADFSDGGVSATSKSHNELLKLKRNNNTISEMIFVFARIKTWFISLFKD